MKPAIQATLVMLLTILIVVSPAFLPRKLLFCILVAATVIGFWILLYFSFKY